MEENGHPTVRLLLYYLELNLVKLLRAKLKNKMAGENVANNLV